MIFLLGYEKERMTYTFEVKTEYQAKRYIKIFGKVGIRVEKVTPAQYVEAKEEIERRIWG